MILPESTFHEAIPAPAAGFSSIVPPAVQSRVTVGPPPAWVEVHQPDESYRPDGGQPYTHLLLDEQYHAGLREHYTHTVQRLETLSAVRASSQWRVEFDPATQEVVIHSLVVRRDGVAVEHAQPERLRFLQREAELDQLVMHGHVTVLALLEDVRPGDTLDFSLTTRHHPRLLRDRFWFFAAVPSAVPLRMCRFSIRFPTGRPFAWKAHAPEFAPSIKEIDAETKWVWTLENTVALEPEAQVPGWHLPPLWLQVSDCATWEEIVAAVGGAWREALHDPELTRIAGEIALATETLGQRVEKALEFVQDEIRYLSVNLELGGQIPSPPGEVLRRRYGDCKDKSFLLSQLLRRLGVSARPVLVSTFWRHSVQELLPTPDIFNHAVVEYELDGRRCWADATLTLQGGGALLRPAPDLRVGLPLSPDAKGLEAAPATATESAYELHETYYLDTTGHSSQLLVQVIARGSDAEELRRLLASEGREAFSKNREQFYRQLYDVKRLLPLEWHDDRAQNVLVLGEAFELPTAVVRLERAQGAAFRFRAHLITSIFAFPDAPARRQPLGLPFPCQVEHRVTIVSTAAPPQGTKPGKDRRTAFEVKWHPVHGPNRWGISIVVKMLKDFVPARFFDQHKKWLTGLSAILAFDVQLPPLVASLWKRRAFRSLLPSPGPAIRLPQGSAVESRTLPAEPAPALTSLDPQAAPPIAEIPPKPKAPPPAPAAVAEASEAPAADVPRERRRRRRSRRKDKLSRLTVVVLVVAGLILFAALLAAILIAQ